MEEEKQSTIERNPLLDGKNPWKKISDQLYQGENGEVITEDDYEEIQRKIKKTIVMTQNEKGVV